MWLLTTNKLATNLIDNLVPDLFVINAFCAKVPRGSYIYPGTPEAELSAKRYDAEYHFQLAANILDMPEQVIRRLVTIANRWYERTRWERGLSDRQADRLLTFLINDHKVKAKDLEKKPYHSMTREDIRQELNELEARAEYRWRESTQDAD